jgi:hypothetical protein
MTVRDLTIDGQGGMPCQLALRNRACALVGSIAERFLRRDKFPRNLANFASGLKNPATVGVSILRRRHRQTPPHELPDAGTIGPADR